MAGTCLELSPAVRPMSFHDTKQQTGRRFRWAALVVPLVLVLIMASTRFLTHPVAFDLFSSPASKSWSQVLAQSGDWQLHRRHPSQQDNPFSPLPSAAFNVLAPTPTSPQLIPTAPFAPPTLPTPFPQPYDSQLTLNFSSASCLRFFTNMTESDAFRKCRPFSLLSQTSATFINAQTNLTLMNALVWGTCNTSLGINQCDANMSWFASTLETVCDEDLKEGNSLAGDTLTGKSLFVVFPSIGALNVKNYICHFNLFPPDHFTWSDLVRPGSALNAYQLMYSAACAQNPRSNTYCYIEAAANSSPADLYLYQLPFGIDLPSSAANFSCSTCSQGLLDIYADNLSNKTLANALDKLEETYEGAASIVDAACGSNFARTTLTNGAPTSQLPYVTVILLTLLFGFWSFVL